MAAAHCPKWFLGRYGPPCRGSLKTLVRWAAALSDGLAAERRPPPPERVRALARRALAPMPSGLRGRGGGERGSNQEHAWDRPRKGRRGATHAPATNTLLEPRPCLLFVFGWFGVWLLLLVDGGFAVSWCGLCLLSLLFGLRGTTTIATITVSELLLQLTLCKLPFCLNNCCKYSSD